MSRVSHHVVPAFSGGWAVKRGGAARASKVFETKKAAESYARKVSAGQGSELVIHTRDGTIQVILKRDGTIQKKDSHSPNPLPPKAGDSLGR